MSLWNMLIYLSLLHVVGAAAMPPNGRILNALILLLHWVPVVAAGATLRLGLFVAEGPEHAPSLSFVDYHLFY